MKPVVLILTGIYDFSADLVVLELEQRGIPFLRINKEHVIDYRFSLSPTLPLLTIESRLEQQQGEWLIDNAIKSIWFRQPVFLRNTPPNPLSIDEQLIRSQWSAFFRAISVFDEAAWMNWPQATYLAESKPYQLLIARRCGLKIPKTIVGNVQVNKAEKSNIIKSLDTVLLREGDDCLFTYSTLVDNISEKESASAPFIIQDYVSNKTDIRVTIIGDNLSAVRILSDGLPVHGDWRVMPKELLQYDDVDLPKSVISSCMNLSKTLNLSFSAIDLLETDGEFYFLEINPTGEWGWLNNSERRFDIQIVDWLTNPI